MYIYVCINVFTYIKVFCFFGGGEIRQQEGVDAGGFKKKKGGGAVCLLYIVFGVGVGVWGGLFKCLAQQLAGGVVTYIYIYGG